MKSSAAPARLSKAQFRVLLYMVRNDTTLIRGQWGSAWTDDAFQWPVPGSTIGHLVKAGLIEKDPRATETDLLMVSALGFGTIKEKLKRALAAQARASRLTAGAPTPLEEFIERAQAHG